MTWNADLTKAPRGEWFIVRGEGSPIVPCFFDDATAYFAGADDIGLPILRARDITGLTGMEWNVLL